MKIQSAFLVIAFTFFIGCDKDNDLPVGNSLEGFSLLIGDRVIVDQSNIDYYDLSSHLIYLKKGTSIPVGLRGEESFSVCVDGREIYSGKTVSGFSSYMPRGPVIFCMPVLYPDYIVSIGYSAIWDSLPGADPRNDKRIVDALRKEGQLHEGLKCEIENVNFVGSDGCIVEIQVRNEDTFNYCLLDPKNMGTDLYHYFTNGLIIMDARRNLYYPKIRHESPEPWNTWDPDWFSVIGRGETRRFLLAYSGYERIPKGQCRVVFNFPGLGYQVSREDVVQKYGRIWLGEIVLCRDIVID